MSEIIISVENLGKCYEISHEHQQGYTALRDVIARKVRGALRVFSSGKHNKNHSTEDFWAIKDVSFDIKQGEAVGIIGRNGAGKSTLLKLLSRITEPTRGRITLNGRVASLLEVGTGFHPELTGRENIFLNGAILGMTRQEIKSKFDEIIDFSGIEKFLDTPVKRYSSGMYVRLAFAVAAHLEPEILVVDEVLAVGDVAFQRKCLGKMNDVSNSGRTVLFVSHNMSAIESLCSRVILLNKGGIEAIGSSTEMSQLYLQNALGNPGDQQVIQSFPISGKKSQITELEFLSQGRHTEIIYMGNDLEIRMKYKTSVQLDNPLLGIILYDMMDSPVALFNNKNYGVYFGKTEQPDGTISLKINNLNLMPGFYSLNVHFGDSLVDLDVKKKCFRFQIIYKHIANDGEVLREPYNKIFFKDVDWELSK